MTDQPQLDEWQVETYRVTLFLTENVAPGLWEQLTGRPPEESTSQQRLHRFVEQGPLESNVLVLQGSLGRLDLWLAAKQHDDVDMVCVGPLKEKLEAFDKTIEKCTEVFKTAIKRVALGLVLRLPVTGREVGYRKLATYLPSVTLDPDNSSEFLYQINRKRTILQEDKPYRINRLSKWSVTTVFRAQISAAIPVGVQAVSEPIFACRLELDMSTATDLEKIPPEHALPILKKLDEQAREIAHRGDIP
jgi:hypothetical protein